jgi:hypothetical protein
MPHDYGAGDKSGDKRRHEAIFTDLVAAEDD